MKKMIIKWGLSRRFVGAVTFIFICIAPIIIFAEEENGQVEQTSISMMKRAVENPIKEKWLVQFGPKAGFFVPYNSDFRTIYGGGGFSYGLSLIALNGDYGLKFEVEHFEAERLLPYNETNKWRNVLSNLAISPFWLSFLRSFSVQLDDESKAISWNAYFGIGIGATIVKERFRGDYWVNNSFQFTDISEVSTLYGVQVMLGMVKARGLGFELKYSYIPRRSDGGFADLGGFTAFLSLSF